MNYIILDMEWNSPESRSFKVRDLPAEIIQIGAVKLNENGEKLGSFTECVAPAYYRKLHRTVAKLTGLKYKELQECDYFWQVIDRFKEWCGSDCAFFTWGGSDLGVLKCNLKKHKMDDKWIPKWYNLQYIYNKQITGDFNVCSLSSAMAHFGIEETDPVHDAGNDARYTALVCEHLDLKKGIENYTELKRVKICIRADYFGAYRDPQQGFESRRVNTLLCPACKKKHHIALEDWIPQKRTKRIAKLSCDCGNTYYISGDPETNLRGKTLIHRCIIKYSEYMEWYYNECIKRLENKNNR